MKLIVAFTSVLALAACASFTQTNPSEAAPQEAAPQEAAPQEAAELFEAWNATEWVVPNANITQVYEAVLAGMKHADIGVQLNNPADGYVQGKSTAVHDAEVNTFFSEEGDNIRVLMSVTGSKTDTIKALDAKKTTKMIMDQFREGFDKKMKGR